MNKPWLPKSLSLRARCFPPNKNSKTLSASTAAIPGPMRSRTQFAPWEESSTPNPVLMARRSKTGINPALVGHVPNAARPTIYRGARGDLFVSRGEVPFNINRSRTTQPGSGDRLPIHVVRTIPRHKHARDICRRAAFRNNVTVLVHVEHAFENLGVWNVADGHEYA